MGGRVVIVGGGLAGLAAASALAPRGFAVTLLESRPRWGGRASSFIDRATGEEVDNCQHVALGCCTNFLQFCRTVGIDRFFQREDHLTFIAPDGAASRLAAAPLPAPFHLVPAFARLGYLSWRAKYRLARGLAALARTDPARCGDESFLEWLKRHGQPPEVIESFWHVVLVSALSETLDRIDVSHARKVFVDSFLRNRHGWNVWLPMVSLGELYGEAVEGWLAAHGVECHLQCGAKQVLPENATNAESRHAAGIELRSGEFLAADDIILATPQFLLADLLPAAWRAIPEFALAGNLETAPISSVHLWFDRAITPLRHATFIGGLSQWLFNRSAIQGKSAGKPAPEASSYYQVVISASRAVTSRPQDETIQAVVAELAALWPAVANTRLVHARLVTEHKAVVSMLPGVEKFRPRQQTSIANLHLAGDWTQTGWPGTMEGAVRSGYLAAESVLRRNGRHEPLLEPDLPTAFLPRLVFGL
jgi:squalene-associated FAD-dependent desaturase